MLFEHLIYSTAIAIIAGMLWYKRTGRDPSWIIIASDFVPDFDDPGFWNIGYKSYGAIWFDDVELYKEGSNINLI